MGTRVVINFPIGGLAEPHPHKVGNHHRQGSREELFWRIVEACYEAAVERIIVVVSEDTIARAGEDLLRDPRFDKYGVRVHQTWSVDTCQAWLTGWGVALGILPCADQASGKEPIGRPADSDRIVLLPGDIDTVRDLDGFFTARLPGFLTQADVKDIVVGDFETGEKLASKDIIDLWGTYPLFEVWFPEIAAATRARNIWKPRSEFLNVRAGVLKELLLGNRKFAYEQTLNMLIRSWDFARAAERKAAVAGPWKHEVAAYPLGVLKDDPDSRDIPGAIDQIERTERLLKMTWREFQFADARAKAAAHAQALATAGAMITSPDARPPTFDDAKWERIYQAAYSERYNEESARILREYEQREAKSRAIEAEARVIVLALLAKRAA